MPINDEILGVLRGGLVSKHEILARVLLGSAIGSLAVDADLDDEVVLSACRRAHQGEQPVGDNGHQDLACKVLVLAVQNIRMQRAEFLALCGAMLQQIRSAAANPDTVDKLRAAAAAANAD